MILQCGDVGLRDLPRRSQEYATCTPLLHWSSPIALAFLFALLGVSQRTPTRSRWRGMPNAEPVAGYAVYVGIVARRRRERDVAITLTTAVAGQQYCFAVAAYNATGEGPTIRPGVRIQQPVPVAHQSGNQTSTVGQSASLQLSGSDPDGQCRFPTAPLAFRPGCRRFGNRFRLRHADDSWEYRSRPESDDGVLQSAAQTFTWSVAAAPTADTTAPSVAISSPTSAASITSSATTISLAGTASDNVGVTSVNWSNDRGGSGVASGTSTGACLPSDCRWGAT